MKHWILTKIFRMHWISISTGRQTINAYSSTQLDFVAGQYWNLDKIHTGPKPATGDDK